MPSVSTLIADEAFTADAGSLHFVLFKISFYSSLFGFIFFLVYLFLTKNIFSVCS